MKKLLLASTLLALSLGVSAQNQNFYDAAIAANSELNGTARFVSVGGAMGALGGDASTVSYNPAGIGVYRSSELTLSGNIHWTNTSMGGDAPSNYISANLANIAYIGTWLNPKEKGLITLNFGITYNRIKNLAREGRYSGIQQGSATQFIANQTNGTDPNYFSDDLVDQFYNTDLAWRSILGYQAYLFDPITNPLNNETVYLPYYTKIGGGNVRTNLQFSEYGAHDEYGISIGGNVENIFYWGMSFNCDYLYYNKRVGQQEIFNDGNAYTMHTNYAMEGCGFAYKLGFIVRPVNWLRIGAAFHTPTWYYMEDWASASVSFKNPSKDNQTDYTDTPVSEGQFYLESPLSAMGSLGFVLGKFGFIGIDYQYTNSQNIILKDSHKTPQDIMNMASNGAIADTHAFRIGAEFKPVDALALRIGGGYTMPIAKEGATRHYYNNDVRCDMDYYNTKASYNVTAGIGYRIDRHAVDLAYVWQVNQADFYAYQGADPIGLRSVRNQLVLTYGIRF